MVGPVETGVKGNSVDLIQNKRLRHTITVGRRRPGNYRTYLVRVF